MYRVILVCLEMMGHCSVPRERAPSTWFHIRSDLYNLRRDSCVLGLSVRQSYVSPAPIMGSPCYKVPPPSALQAPQSRWSWCPPTCDRWATVTASTFNHLTIWQSSHSEMLEGSLLVCRTQTVPHSLPFFVLGTWVWEADRSLMLWAQTALERSPIWLSRLLGDSKRHPRPTPALLIYFRILLFRVQHHQICCPIQS